MNLIQLLCAIPIGIFIGITYYKIFGKVWEDD